ncbi:hypothetical protein [Sulfuricella sp. T08]|uniref:hypothetical protein n=1 Tax=Sulfuricella sp. T08 TaxID=1632857 RepID=UPI001185B076|nr:hypothetical protein [Sulfuricella sp. T08]
MATENRIIYLKVYCDQWKDSLDRAEGQRDRLIELKNSGLSAFDDDGKELLPIMIEEADEAARLYKRILTKMESLRDRAISGGDV